MRQLNPPGTDYQELLARHGRNHWWSSGMRQITWELLGNVRGRLLDAGCGPGWLLGELQSGAWGVGVDLKPRPMLPVRIVAGNLVRLPFASATFDAVVALDVLEQRGVDPGNALTELCRALISDGRLLVRVPAYSWLHGPHDQFWGGARRFRAAELTGLMSEAGFAMLRLTYANSLLFPQAAASRLLARAGLPGREELSPASAPYNRVLRGVLSLEAGWLRRHNLPVGLSLFCLGRREGA